MTSTTWTSHHRRGEVLRRVMEAADERRDGILPTDVDGVAETFGDSLDLLGALQLRWHTRLAGRIERELVSQPMDLESAVVAAWCGTAQEMPGVRAILDHYRAEPVDRAMAHATVTAGAKEHVLLAVMAGRSSSADEHAVRAGEEIAHRARATYTHRQPTAGPTAHRARPRGLVDRIRSVVAA
jgi:hypothetical protein